MPPLPPPPIMSEPALNFGPQWLRDSFQQDSALAAASSAAAAAGERAPIRGEQQQQQQQHHRDNIRDIRDRTGGGGGEAGRDAMQ